MLVTLAGIVFWLCHVLEASNNRGTQLPHVVWSNLTAEVWTLGAATALTCLVSFEAKMRSCSQLSQGLSQELARELELLGLVSFKSID